MSNYPVKAPSPALCLNSVLKVLSEIVKYSRNFVSSSYLAPLAPLNAGTLDRGNHLDRLRNYDYDYVLYNEYRSVMKAS